MNKEQIGSFILDQRKQQKLSQKQLAERAGFTRYQQVLEIEKGQFDYGINVLTKVIKALGYELSFVPIDKVIPFRLVCNRGLDVAPAAFDFLNVEAAKEEEPPKKINGHKTKFKRQKAKAI